MSKPVGQKKNPFTQSKSHRDRERKRGDHETHEMNEVLSHNLSYSFAFILILFEESKQALY